MLTVYYDPETQTYSFMSHVTDNGIKDLDELMETVAHMFTNVCASIEGDFKELYTQSIAAIAEYGLDEEVSEKLDEIIEYNEMNIFTNDETKEEAVIKMAKDMKRDIGEEGYEFLREYLEESFIELAQEIYDVDVTHVFQEKEEEQESEINIDDYEDDLF